MIKPQYIFDDAGNKVGVFVVIDDWHVLRHIPGVYELIQGDDLVPEWQVRLAEKELKNTAEGTTELMDWSEAKKSFNCSSTNL